MIKKCLLAGFIFLSFVFFTAGCMPSAGKIQADQNYMVSSMGFDSDGENLKISVEAIIVNSENTDSEQKLEVLCGEGQTVAAALGVVGKSLTKPLLLSHCGVIVLGESLNPKQISEICNYCFEENEITLSVCLVSANNANTLLSCKPVSSIAMGYDIMGIIEQQSGRTGVNYKNRYYEVEAGRNRKQNIFTVPILKVENEKYYVDGSRVYKDDKSVASLDSNQAVLYSILTDTYRKGEIVIDNKKYKINSTNVKYNFNYQNNSEIIVDIKVNSDTIDAKTHQTLQNQIKELVETLNSTCQTDVFGFENIIYHKDEKNWEKIEKDYISFYENSEIKVDLTVDGKSKK